MTQHDEDLHDEDELKTTDQPQQRIIGFINGGATSLYELRSGGTAHDPHSGQFTGYAHFAAQHSAAAHSLAQTAKTGDEHLLLAAKHWNAHDFHHSASKDKTLSKTQREYHKAQAKHHKQASQEAETKGFALKKEEGRHKVGGYIPSKKQQ